MEFFKQLQVYPRKCQFIHHRWKFPSYSPFSPVDWELNSKPEFLFHPSLELFPLLIPLNPSDSIIPTFLLPSA